MGPAIMGCLGSEGVKTGNTYVPLDSRDSLTDTKLQEPQRSITCPQSRILPWVPWHLPSSQYWCLPHTSESHRFLPCSPAGSALPLSAQPTSVSRWDCAVLPPRKYWVSGHPQTAICFITLWLGCYGRPQSPMHAKHLLYR